MWFTADMPTCRHHTTQPHHTTPHHTTCCCHTTGKYSINFFHTVRCVVVWWWRFTRYGAYDFVWDSVRPRHTTPLTIFLFPVSRGRWVCWHARYLPSTSVAVRSGRCTMFTPTTRADTAEASAAAVHHHHHHHGSLLPGVLPHTHPPTHPPNHTPTPPTHGLDGLGGLDGRDGPGKAAGRS